MAERTTVYMRLDEIQPADRNAKDHDAQGLAASISQFGLIDTPVLDERTQKLIGGHGRVEDLAARKAAGGAPPEDCRLAPDGEWEVPVQRGWGSKDDAEASAAAIALNRIGEGKWHTGILASELAEVGARSAALLAATGFGADALTDLMALVTGPPSIKELEDKNGPPGERDFWPVLRVMCAPPIAERWGKIVGQYDDEAAAFAALVRAWDTRPAEAAPAAEPEPIPDPEPDAPTGNGSTPLTALPEVEPPPDA